MNIFKVTESFKNQQEEIKQLLLNFNTIGEVFGNQKRNTIRVVDFKGTKLNIKSFKAPKAFNSFVYKYIRKSKAERSFSYAKLLSKKKIGTPQPVAYFEESTVFGITNSYYVSEHIEANLTYRELVKQPDYENHEIILRQFVHFTHQLHENNILFNDHSPGNTLIKKSTKGYNFYLVDLNRMNFKELSFLERMKNFSRLTPKEEMVGVMSDEYSKITGIHYQKVFSAMWGFTSKFQHKFFRKKRLKKKFLFWRNSK